MLRNLGADDFCKVFDAQMAKYTFKVERKRKYHRESRMSKAEIMVIMILFHSIRVSLLEAFLSRKGIVNDELKNIAQVEYFIYYFVIAKLRH